MVLNNFFSEYFEGKWYFFVGCQGKCIIFIAHLKEMILGTGSHKEAIYQSRNIFNI